MDTESSFGLVRRAKAGDSTAVDRLILRYLPRLRRWIHRRLPAWARDIADTEDLVQETLVNAVRNLPRLEMRNQFSFRAYMKRAARNRVNDEMKRADRHLSSEGVLENIHAKEPSAFQRIVAREDLWRCRVALARLPPADRRLILLALSDGSEAKRLARKAGKSSGDAARMALNRALRRLAVEMERLTS